MTQRNRIAPLLTAAMLMPACAGLTESHVSDFESAALNRAWYGAYDRPLPDASGADIAAADARRDAQAAAAQARRDERQTAVASRRQQRDDAAAVAAAEEQRAREALAAARAQVGGTAPATPAPVASPQPTASPAPVAASTARPPLPETRGDSAYDPFLAAAYLRAVYAANETPAGDSNGRVVDLYRYAQQEGTVYHSTPAVGDLVFFHNTFDADSNGRNNDWYTHAGLVEDVSADGTIAVLSYVDGRVARTFMNLTNPSAETLNGRTVNSVMRRRSNSDPEYTLYLAGELFAGFAGLLGNREEVVVLDTWQPPSSMVAASR